MSYEKQTFSKGQVLKADHLNHMEDGIVDLEQQIKNSSSSTTPNLTISVIFLARGYGGFYFIEKEFNDVKIITS